MDTHDEPLDVLKLLSKITDRFISGLEEELRMNPIYWPEGLPGDRNSFTTEYFEHQMSQMNDVLEAFQYNLPTVDISSEAFFEDVESKLDWLIKESKQLATLIDVALRVSPKNVPGKAAKKYVSMVLTKAKEARLELLKTTVKPIGEANIYMASEEVLANSLSKLIRPLESLIQELHTISKEGKIVAVLLKRPSSTTEP